MSNSLWISAGQCGSCAVRSMNLFMYVHTPESLRVEPLLLPAAVFVTVGHRNRVFRGFPITADKADPLS